jgi:hypothetical protein
MSSVDPPPMSKTSTLRASGAISGLAPATASRASVSLSMTSSSSPISSRTRAMNSAPLLAVRQASVAISRALGTCHHLSLLAHTLSALMVRAMASRLSVPDLADAFAEADDAGKGVDDLKTGRRLRHQQAAIVGAQVKRPVELLAMRPRRSPRAGPMPPAARPDGGMRLARRSSGPAVQPTAAPPNRGRVTVRPSINLHNSSARRTGLAPTGSKPWAKDRPPKNCALPAV